MMALLAVTVAYGLQSLIDWTWFVPGVTIPALLCAGWLAGRGRLETAGPARARRGDLRKAPARISSALAIGAATLLALWVMWQPLRSSQADSTAIAAEVHGNLAAAIDDARTAAAEAPVSGDPKIELAQFYVAAGRTAQARRELAGKQPGT